MQPGDGTVVNVCRENSPRSGEPIRNKMGQAGFCMVLPNRMYLRKGYLWVFVIQVFSKGQQSIPKQFETRKVK